MREVEIFTWRTQWCGKWSNTKHKWSEADMKARNPEAIKFENSREVRLLPETPEELRQAQYASFWPPAAQQTVVKPQGSDLAKEMGPQHQDS